MLDLKLLCEERRTAKVDSCDATKVSGSKTSGSLFEDGTIVDNSFGEALDGDAVVEESVSIGASALSPISRLANPRLVRANGDKFVARVLFELETGHLLTVEAVSLTPEPNGWNVVVSALRVALCTGVRRDC